MNEWTEETPTKKGYYWAYEALDACDANVILVYVTGGRLAYTTFEVIFDLSHFSHWIGPLVLPDIPNRITSEVLGKLAVGKWIVIDDNKIS